MYFESIATAVGESDGWDVVVRKLLVTPLPSRPALPMVDPPVFGQ